MQVALPIILFVVGFVLGAGVIWFVRQRELDARNKNEIDLQETFDNLSRKALVENQEAFLKRAKSEFETLKESAGQQMAQKKELIDQSLQNINQTLKSLGEGTNSLRGQIQESAKRIDTLNTTTDRLRAILSSSQARGQWGERMVEDILNFLGMMEGVNYTKQSMEGGDRPDYTFMLPRGKRLNMDVKFPITHFEQFLGAESESLKTAEKKQFLNDVRMHVTAISRRSYIDPAGGTVDYVLMFIPNEGIYSFINQEDHELIDFAMGRKIVLCSPLTLYAILSLIHQSVASFALEQQAGELQKLVQAFSQQWEKFEDKVDKMGNSLRATQNHFDDLKTTRSNQLQRPMNKILGLKLHQPPEGSASPSLPDAPSQ